MFDKLLKKYQDKFTNTKNALKKTREIIIDAKSKNDFEQIEFSKAERIDLLLKQRIYFEVLEDLDGFKQEIIDLKKFNEQLINDKRLLLERLHSSINIDTFKTAYNALEDENKRLKQDIERFLSTLNEPNN